MRPIIAIITIIGVINGFQLFTFAQGTENFEKRYEDSLTANHQRRSFPEDQQLERRFGIFSAIKGIAKVGKAIGTAVYNSKHHHRRSYDESLEERDQQLERRELEKRFGIFAAIKGAFKVGKLIATAIHNRKHHRRSYDELLEERDQLLELRDHLHGAHGYLAKRSDYDSLANDIVKRLVIQKRGVDYLLGLNARDLVERDVDAGISDLD